MPAPLTPCEVLVCACRTCVVAPSAFLPPTTLYCRSAAAHGMGVCLLYHTWWFAMWGSCTIHALGSGERCADTRMGGGCMSRLVPRWPLLGGHYGMGAYLAALCCDLLLYGALVSYCSSRFVLVRGVPMALFCLRVACAVVASGGVVLFVDPVPVWHRGDELPWRAAVRRQEVLVPACWGMLRAGVCAGMGQASLLLILVLFCAV